MPIFESQASTMSAFSACTTKARVPVSTQPRMVRFDLDRVACFRLALKRAAACSQTQSSADTVANHAQRAALLAIHGLQYRSFDLAEGLCCCTRGVLLHCRRYRRPSYARCIAEAQHHFVQPLAPHVALVCGVQQGDQHVHDERVDALVFALAVRGRRRLHLEHQFRVI